MRMDFSRENAATDSTQAQSNEAGTFHITGTHPDLISLGADLANHGYQGFMVPATSGMALNIVVLDAHAELEVRRLYKKWRATHLIL